MVATNLFAVYGKPATMSRITLAFMQDTGWYDVNWDNAGEETTGFRVWWLKGRTWGGGDAVGCINCTLPPHRRVVLAPACWASASCSSATCMLLAVLLAVLIGGLLHRSVDLPLAV